MKGIARYWSISVGAAFILMCNFAPTAHTEKYIKPELSKRVLMPIEKRHQIEQVKKKRSNAGVLPYCFDLRGNAYFLIGKEHDGEWADFGGNKEKGDLDSRKTAAREFSEETRLVYGKFANGMRPLEKSLSKKEQKKITRFSTDYITERMNKEFQHPKHHYRMYLAKVDFIPADTFNNAASTPGYEKESYAWVPVDELMSEIKKETNRWRAHYLNKKIRRQFYDIVHTYHDEILNIIYPDRYTQQETPEEENA